MKESPPKEPDRVALTIRVSGSTHDGLRALADDEDRSLNNYVNRVLFEHVVMNEAKVPR